MIILSYCQASEDEAVSMEPSVVYVDDENKIAKLSSKKPLC